MCRWKKENKNLKVVERFRVEREFAQGNLCVELKGASNVVCRIVFIGTFLDEHTVKLLP